MKRKIVKVQGPEDYLGKMSKILDRGLIKEVKLVSVNKKKK